MKEGDGIRHYLSTFEFEDKNLLAWARKVLEVSEGSHTYSQARISLTAR